MYREDNKDSKRIQGIKYGSTSHNRSVTAGTLGGIYRNDEFL